MPQLPKSPYPEYWEKIQRNKFGEILERDLSTLLRESSTEFNFLETKERIVNVREAVNTIAHNTDFWVELSETKRNAVNNALDDIIAQFGEMEHFNPKTDSPWETRNQIISNFINRYNGFYDTVITPLNAYLGKRAYDQELTSKFGQEAKNELDEIRRVKLEIEKVQKEIGDAAAVASDVASAAHSVSFANQAQDHQKLAYIWLGAIIVSMFISSIIVTYIVLDIVKHLGTKESSITPEAAATKIVILGFLFYAIRFTVRNYSGHQHLAVVNKHRSNVLQSMEAFRTSTSDETTKDAILLAAVSAAYSQQETGFITTKEGAGSESSEITKIVESTMKKG